MKKNSAGIIISVKDIAEVGESMVHCGLCDKDFIPSLDCDVFTLRDRRGADGEMPLQCEVCMDRGIVAEGMGIIDLSRPDGARITPAGRPAKQEDNLLSRVRYLFRKK